MDKKAKGKGSKAKGDDIKLLELEEKCQELEDGWKRTQAEFMNYKNRTEKEKAELADYIKKDVVVGILPVYDNLKRGYEMVEDKAGYEMVIKSFEDTLKNSFNMVPIECEGEFDANICEAIGFKEEGGKSGDIAEVVETGFESNGNVVRPAKVLLYK